MNSAEYSNPHFNGLDKETIENFRAEVCIFYKKHGRKLPWRETNNPYHILVSEIMLQQTQVARVIGKYHRFIMTFPTIESLAQTSLGSIYSVWQGLGYNRRVLLLHKCAQMITEKLDGRIPSDVDFLMRFPGIGRTTASAIAAFAFSKPAVFIETNIRTVFIHCFFPEKDRVADSEIAPLVAATLDTSNPREWYYALMDYGVMLKKKFPGVNKISAHYTRQTPFAGSDRQIRGMILKSLNQNRRMTEKEVTAKLNVDRKRVKKMLDQLLHEGFITKKDSVFTIM